MARGRPHAPERVNEALSWFIGSYTAFAQWRATVDRLTEFAAEIENDFGELGPGSVATGEPRANRGPRRRSGPRR